VISQVTNYEGVKLQPHVIIVLHEPLQEIMVYLIEKLVILTFGQLIKK
jgi:hypothetical protein